ncbi:MAG: 2-oxoglutarate dehydrogenase E1 component, partial [Sediminibacterium sp.]|nr:2-oxoglutarate dehydrogenase E1 component [Sediminibacterium sp.]
MKDFSYITNSHPAFIEETYKAFVQDPSSVDPDLKKFFEGFDFAVSNGHAGTGAATSAAAASTTSSSGIDWQKEINVYRLILGYRNRGHLLSTTNPIRPRKDRQANLDLSYFSLSDSDLSQTFQAGKFVGLGAATLKNILTHLQTCYTSSVGAEFKYISNKEKVSFLISEMETNFKAPIHLDKKKHILEKLNQGVIFEKFLHTKYIGQKRFSLEGGESTIAALDAIINTAASHDVQEVVIGMAHRGRLNV